MTAQAPRSKMEWYKHASRAAQDLSHAEFRVLMAVASYSDKMGGSAHPGKERVATDTGIHAKNVQKHLRALEDQGWLLVRQIGGNALFRGAATVYQLGAPEKGSNSIPKGSTQNSSRGVAITPPSDHSPDPLDHSAGAASPAPQSTARIIRPNVRDWTRFDDLDHLTGWLDHHVPEWQSDHVAQLAVPSMWEDERHPKSILSYVLSRHGLKLAA